ncbi:Elongator protein 3/MiaB/NifB [Syntrophomonas zehnderi OL-4]|uniref:Elongator protein 3/MiaB/NifB n=1 Tax=Syntrophomonas zehnderi OL-4 TaxID=690567 RepID=A0A0E4C893_9FIRM|nr:AmmeMemoRadiSam system radical SAM enzyme [Syntrophomonas zehnderi]CFX05814.1 Elongator protein 3/MiaB/NifB [Syntrophomonas zehnderi OL-4]CFX34246.1 Elongator protein 3/MiaB/NifB [Syntrophomonas zehnderi OL-4]
MTRQVDYFTPGDKGIMVCRVCPHNCQLKTGQTGICRVRANQEDKLTALNYGQVSSLALDPIEKKPLYHFYPGTMILSVGSFGCNLACSFCQNYSIAQQSPPTRYISPAELAALTAKYSDYGSIGLAFTYNEPLMWLEYIMDVAPRLKEQGFKVVLVSNGFIEKKPLRDLLPFVDAWNVDVKAFNENFYRRLCKGRLDCVKHTVEEIVGKAHLEITTLLIPEENETEEEIRDLARWLASLDPDLVLHLSRYYPAYRMTSPPTGLKTLRNARQIAREYLNYVYLGNVAPEENEM